MARYRVTTVAQATIEEVWFVEVADGLRHGCEAVVNDGDADFQSERILHDSEGERRVIAVKAADDPEPSDWEMAWRAASGTAPNQ